MKFRTGLILVAAAALSFSAASATTIDWVQWSDTFATGTTTGSASGTFASGVNLSYAGEVRSLQFGYPSWTPAATFNAGTGNAPPSAGGMVGLVGGLTSTDTITFSKPVTNPYIAIWSLGAPSSLAMFTFDQTPAGVDSGGPSAEFGGSAITLTGNTVFGSEGNGVIHFNGSFSSISWNNPEAENYYGFTVGIIGPACTPGTTGCGSGNPGVPEPLSVTLFGAALAGFGIRRRRRG